ncbi:MAG: 5-formyltetrahydrofolate cyclo-ligase [Candidatus Bathyarchaeia archaeon]
MELHKILRPDLLIVGSVTVTLEGGRLGKGSGYSELEYGILSELGLIGEDTPVVATVRELQIFEHILREIYDINVDAIATPNRIVRANPASVCPRGVLWNLVTEDMMREMPILENLYRMRRYELGVCGGVC